MKGAIGQQRLRERQLPATAALSLGVLGGTCILGDAEAKDRPAASSISTGMTEERGGLISDMGA